MEKSTILTADLLDIVFEYRNKLYGAYDLRKTYPKRIAYALGGTFFICLLFIVGTIMANGKKSNRPVDLANEVILTKYEDPKPLDPVIPPPKQEVKPPEIELAKVTPPLIVPDDQVKPEDEVKPIENLENVKISDVNRPGKEDDGMVAPPVETTSSIAEAPRVNKDIDDIVTFVHIEARFAGGTEAWVKYLKKNLNSDLPAQNGAPANKYTVIVSFVVDKTGVISDVRAENDPGYGTQAEAIRVIQKSPNWTPAVQNGTNVKYRQKQSITFQVVEE